MPEIDRLTVVWDARFDRMEEKLNKVVRSNYAAADRVAKKWDGVNDNFAKSSAKGALEGIASASAVSTTALTRLGTAGLAAGAVLGALTVALRKASETAQWADDLQAAADRIGVTAESLQELRYAAEAVDVPMADAEKALEGLNAALGAIQTGVGDGKIKKVFAELGIPKEQLATLDNAADLLPILADRIKAAGTTAEQVQLAKKLGVEALLPLLRQGSAGVEALTGKARELGLVLDNEVIGSSAEMNERLRVTNERAAAASRTLSASFIPTLVQIKEAAIGAAGALASMFTWLNKSRPDSIDFKQETLEKTLRSAQIARQQARSIRSGSGLDAFLSGASGLQAMTPAGREAAARERDAEADRLTRRAAMLSGDLAAATEAARKAAEAAAKAAETAADIGSGGKGTGGSKKETAAERSDIFMPNGQRAYDPLTGRQLETPEDRRVREWREARFPEEDIDKDPIIDLDDLKPLKRLTRDAAFDGLEEGIEGALRAAADGDIVEYFARKLQAAAFDGLSDALAKALSQLGQGDGLLASGARAVGRALSIPGFASGTNSAPGGLAYVHAGEVLANLPKGSQVIPAHAVRAMANMQPQVIRGGGQTALNFMPSITIDARGADDGAARRMEASMAQFKREMPSQIISVMEDHLERTHRK